MASSRPSRRVKDALYPHLARIGKAVASPHRLELLHLLSHGEKPVETLAAETSLTVKNASAHLRVLREARLVQWRKAGQQVFYQLADPAVAGFILGLRDLAERRLAEVRELSKQYFGGRKQMTPVDRRQLLSASGTGASPSWICGTGRSMPRATFPAPARSRCRSSGRRSAPSRATRKWWPTVTGPTVCSPSKPWELLSARGYRATRLEDSVVEWAAAGLPVERGGAGERD